MLGLAVGRWAVSDAASARDGRQTAAPRFGVMLSSPQLSVEGKMALVWKLGCRLVRPQAVFLDQWNGRQAECEAARKAGLTIALTVRNSKGKKPPTDLAAYRRTLTEVLDKYPPAILIVENEENSNLFYTGTPEEYGKQLAAAVEAARPRKIPVANGGLVSKLVVFLVYEQLSAQGRTAEAAAFLDATLPKEQQKLLMTEKAKDQLARGKALLAEYKQSGIDYVNFHWYASHGLASGEALEQAVKYLHETTGLPVICNEMGQQFDERPEPVVKLLTKASELKLPYVVWYGIDSIQSRGLVEPDGTLRSNGKAFGEFMRRPPASP